MINKILQLIFSVTALGILLIPQPVLAQSVSTSSSQLSLSLTPPLIQLSLSPGETWKSTLKVINTNEYDLPLYANIAFLEANGDEGQSKFTPVLEGDTNNSLANWIKVDKSTFEISREKSYELPFTITIPEDAPPGGHYAAIIVGSQPLNEKNEGPTISVSSSISSLLFLRVAGDVVEQADIREFTTDQNFYSKPNVNFTLRFENKGNVHVQPQGEIAVTNMWGKQRGVIPINQKTRFGNVLPNSTRKFEFEWKGAWNPLEFGRYRAEAVLTYGTDSKQNVSSVTHFWVIPLKEALVTLGGIGIFILLVLWAIRRYIRRSLALETERLTGKPLSASKSATASKVPSTGKTATKKTTTAKKVASRGKMATPESKMAVASNGFVSALLKKVTEHQIFFISAGIILVGLIGIVIYFTQVLQSDRDYEVEIKKADNKNVTLKNGELVPDEQPVLETKTAPESNSTSATEPATNKQIIVDVLNGAGTPGLARTVANIIEGQNQEIGKVGNTALQARTTIQYNIDDEAVAKSINNTLGDQAELQKISESSGTITVTLGKDFKTTY